MHLCAQGVLAHPNSRISAPERVGIKKKKVEGITNGWHSSRVNQQEGGQRAGKNVREANITNINFAKTSQKAPFVS